VNAPLTDAELFRLLATSAPDNTSSSWAGTSCPTAAGEPQAIGLARKVPTTTPSKTPGNATARGPHASKACPNVPRWTKGPMPDSYILSRMECEDIDEEEANYRTWIDVYGELMGHNVAVEEAKKMRAQGAFKAAP
jgi:hypothetical protein